MKTLKIFFFALAFISNAFAQGTFNFAVKLAPTTSDPEYEVYQGVGHFYLNGNMFNGEMGFNAPQWTYVRIQDTSGFMLPATEILSAPPNTGFRARWDATSLTEPELTSLLTQGWLVNVGSTGFPDGILQGRITLVPEPSIIGLIALSAMIALLRKRRS